MIEVREINSTEELNEFKAYEANRLHVLKVGAPWCGQCRVVDSILKNLDPSQIGETLFASIEIGEDTEDFAEEYDITAIPVLIYFKDGMEINRMQGIKSQSDIINSIGQYQG